MKVQLVPYMLRKELFIFCVTDSHKTDPIIHQILKANILADLLVGVSGKFEEIACVSHVVLISTVLKQYSKNVK